MTQALALELTTRLISWALLISSLEFWQLRHRLDDSGPMAWWLLRKDFAQFPRPLLRALDFIYQQKIFSWIPLLLLALSLLTLLAPGGAALLSWRVFPCLRLILWLLLMWRWRGAFNGGSDFMTLLILMMLALASLFPSWAFLGRGALFYLGLQVIYSYWIAGWVKIRVPAWRSGRALAGFLQTSQVRGRAPLGRSLSPWILRFLSWLVMLTELLFPLLMVHPVTRALGLFGALCFHGVVFYLFGLNRFVWAWLSGFPAVWFLCSEIFGH